MKMKGIKLALSASAAMAPVMPVISSVSTVISAEETDSISDNLFLNFMSSVSPAEGITYKKGVTVINDSVNYDDETEGGTISVETDKLNDLGEGDIFVLTKYNEREGKPFKVVSVETAETGATVKYTEPELSEVVKSYNVVTTSKSQMISRIKNSKTVMEEAIKKMTDAGFSTNFTSMMQASYDEIYGKVFDGVDDVDATDLTAENTYVKEVNARLINAGYKTSATDIISAIENFNSTNTEKAIAKLSVDDIKSVNLVLDTFATVYSGATSAGIKTEAFNTMVSGLTTLKDELSEEHKDDTQSTTNKTDTSQTTTETTKQTTSTTDSTTTQDVQVGDFSGEFIISEMPTKFDETTIKAHSVTTQDGVEAHEYSYYRVVVGADGKETEMMALANNDNVTVLQNYEDGVKVKVSYTVSKCVDGKYDYVITKMEKVDSTVETTESATLTGTNADTNVQNNGIYYTVGLGVAAVGLGAVVIKKKKETK